MSAPPNTDEDGIFFMDWKELLKTLTDGGWWRYGGANITCRFMAIILHDVFIMVMSLLRAQLKLLWLELSNKIM